MATDIFRPITFGKETFHAQSFDAQSFVMHWTVAKGGKVPGHYHQHMDEHFLITEGEILFAVNGEKILKKAGESYFVPKGVVHAVINHNKGNSSAKVTYSPCADTHRMFEIIAALDNDRPGSMMNMMIYFYLVPKLGLKEFSTIHPKMVMAIMRGLVNTIGFFGRWKKYTVRFGTKA